jgi:phosphatidylserine/phosphatidylglycerophosphate/cardiolipin synthase-like enzyme
MLCRADICFKPVKTVRYGGHRLSLKTTKHDSTDENFRRDAANLIDSARKEVLVIIGDIRAYGFPDLKWAVERARKKGVSVRIYAANPPQQVVNGLLAKGIQVYKGLVMKDHYLIIDSKSYIHAKPHPPVVGRREGEVYLNKPAATRKVVKRFEKLVEKSKPLTKVDWKQDPLWKALQKPLDWKVDTHSSRLDEEFA